MLKNIALVILIVLLLAVVFFTIRLFLLGRESADGTAPGLADGRLQQCPGSPNCVSSEYPEDTAHYVAPLTLVEKDPDLVGQWIAQAIAAMDGEVQRTDDNYVAATFTSRLFGFVDDFEVRLDADAGMLHMRSASRVGHSDLGVNAERVNRFQKTFARLVAENSH